MIITLRVKCIQGRYLQEECVRVIEIEDSASLLEFHSAIQDSVGFDYDHLFEFFAGRNYRQCKLVFTDSANWEYEAEGLDDVSLEQVYPLPKGLKLYYHFDFGDDWYFEIRKSRKKPVPSDPAVSYPRVVESIGPDPQQYDEYDE